MKLNLEVNRRAGRPLYKQIADQIADRVRDGGLQPGERLPTVRALAAELEVTEPTVHKAFKELRARGCVEATVGRGTFVRRPDRRRELAIAVARRITPDSVMADIQRLTGEPGVRNLAHAEPDATLLPTDEFFDCLATLRESADPVLQYVSPQGDPALRDELTRMAERRGVVAAAAEILVTSGVTQAMSLVTAALARPGERVVVERPTYLGLLQVLEAQGVRPVGVPLDDDGPRLDVLERIVEQERPRFFYTIPVFHNPTGRSMSESRRRELLQLAERHGLTVVEDDIYHRLSFDGDPPPPLKTLDRSDRVIYLDGFSKTGLPGARIGYIAASRTTIERLVTLRRAADLCGALPLQRAMALFLRRGCLRAHLRQALPRYRGRRDAVLQALAERMPGGVTWTEPAGGFSTWLTLPAGEAYRDLYWAALERGVLVTPGEVFETDPDGSAHLRLCFGNQPRQVLRESVEMLARLIEERQGRHAPPSPRAVADRVPLV